MAIETREEVMSVPKQSAEVLDFVEAVWGAVKEKKGVMGIAADSWQEAQLAFEGWDQLDDEAKSEKLPELLGYSMKVIASLLLKK